MSSQSEKNIKVAFILNLCFSLVELIGGFLTNSISISSDSIHEFGDCISIFISWLLEKKSEQKPNKFYTYGYQKFSVLGGLINSCILVCGASIIFINAINKIFHPEPINYNGVLFLAILGLFFNGLGAYKTFKGEKINEKSVSLHLFEDVLSWFVVLVTSIFMKIFDMPILDPILSIFITCFILFNACKNIGRVFNIFLDKVPKDIDPDQIKIILLENTNIKDVHHVHLWTDGVNNFATVHIIILDNADQNKIINIKRDAHKKLLTLNINHATLEFEFQSEHCSENKCDKLKNENLEIKYQNHHQYYI